MPEKRRKSRLKKWKNQKCAGKTAKNSPIRRIQDTPVAVCNYGAQKPIRKAIFDESKSEKSAKKISKIPLFPLEIKKRFMYNSPVVCLGMKW